MGFMSRKTVSFPTEFVIMEIYVEYVGVHTGEKRIYAEETDKKVQK